MKERERERERWIHDILANFCQKFFTVALQYILMSGKNLSEKNRHRRPYGA
jgi:hypothetical protein